MKKIMSFLVLVALIFSIPSISTGAQNTSKTAVTVEVTLKYSSSMTSPKCRVTNIRASKSDKYIVFSMDYESDVRRDYCVFNPPSGSIFKIFDSAGLAAGKHNKKFRVEAEKISKTAILTISFYQKNSKEMNFIYMDTLQLSSLMSKEQAKNLTNLKQENQNANTRNLETKTGEFDKVSFDVTIQYTSDIESPNCRVTSLKAGKMGDCIAFSMDYESDVQRSYYAFNPPSGTIFMITDSTGLPPGKQNKKFKVETVNLTQTDTLTISLLKSNSNERNFVFFNTSQLDNLINNVPINNPTGKEMLSKPSGLNQQGQIQSTTADSSKKTPGEFDSVSFDVSVAYSNFQQRPECIVTSLKAGKMGDYIAFSMDYESDVQRNYSFFNPPSGSIVMVSDSTGLPAGKQNKKFKVEADKLSKALSITVLFFKSGSDDRYSLTFATNQLISLMNEEQRKTLMSLDTKAPVTEKNYSEFDNVNFDLSLGYYSSFESHDCKVTSLKAAKMGDYIAFSMDYEGEVQRGYSIFNPPLGSIFMVDDKEGLPAGKHTVKFKVEASKLRMANDITIKLYRYVSENNYVYFKPSQLNSLLN